MYAIRSYYGGAGRAPDAHRRSGPRPGGPEAVEQEVEVLLFPEEVGLVHGEEVDQFLPLRLAGRITSYNVCYTKLLR